MSGVRVPAPPPTLRPPARLRRIEPILRRALRGPCRVPPGGRILVALSGGADSTALLAGLHRLAPEFGWSLAAAHLHHGLRGKGADSDLGASRSLCERLDVPFLSARWNTRERMRRRGLAGQAGLSRLRREFLLSACRRAGAVAIATGHTADDQMETLLLRLLRGAGLRGLGAMSERRGRWIRPLLEASRDWIEADLRGAGVPWREDPSNADPRYARNRIRHDVIPALMRAADASSTPDGAALRAARGGLARRVAAGLAEVRKARQVVESRARRLLDRAAGDGSGPGTRNRDVALDLACLRAAPSVVAGAALRLAWAGLVPGVGLTSRHVEGLSGLVASGRGGARLDLPRGWTASRHGGVLRIGRAKVVHPSLQPALSQRVREPDRVPDCGVR